VRERSLEHHLRCRVEQWLGEGWTDALDELLEAEAGPRPVLLVDGWDELGDLGTEVRDQLLGFLGAQIRAEQWRPDDPDERLRVTAALAASMQTEEDLAHHPEQRPEPLSWGLQHVVRGDVVLPDGTELTLDDLCDEIGEPHLPYLEEMPDELEVDWSEEAPSPSDPT